MTTSEPKPRRLLRWRNLPHLLMWLFLIGTLWVVGSEGLGLFRGAVSAERTFHVFSISSGEVDWASPGLTYTGYPGAVLALVETIVVLGGLILAFAPRPRLRRIGLGVLLAWAALWALNAIWYGQLGGGWLNAAAFTFAFLCTAWVVVARWRPKRKRPAAPADAEEAA